jgi:predicted PurR-regulated permease PerM
MFDIDSFFAERRYSLIVVLITVFVAFLLLYISWPWASVFFLTLWGAYILWFPARWLERRIHRRVLSSFLVMLFIIVVYVVLFGQVIYILHNSLTSFQVETTSANTTLSSAFATALGPAFGGSQAPTVTNVSAGAGQSGSQLLTAFVDAALAIIDGIIKGAPIYLFQLFIVTVLVWYLLVRGDRVVAEFKALAPRKHRDTVDQFLDHINSIYHALYVNYIFAAVIAGIIALVFFPIAGVPYAATLAFLMTTIGIIPVIGKALVYVPVSLYFFIIGDPVKGLWVLIVSIILFQIIVGTYVVPALGRRGKARIPKPVALLAYVVPFAAIGLSGVIIGPAVYGFALALYRTYLDKRKKEDALAEQPPPTDASTP